MWVLMYSMHNSYQYTTLLTIKISHFTAFNWDAPDKMEHLNTQTINAVE